MIRSDCHTHTIYSGDGNFTMREMVGAAIEHGMSCLTLTDHMDYYFPEVYKGGFLYDVEAWFNEFSSVRDEFSGSIDLLAGIELGLRNEPSIVEYVKKKCEEVTSRFDFDFVIGSTHVLSNCDPYYPIYWKDKDRGDVFREYFESIAFSAGEYDCFDSYGHIDYIVRYCPTGDREYNPAEFYDVIDRILLTLIRKGKALECNSAGLRKGLRFFHPKFEVLKRYRELGGKLITVGSDAHFTKDIGADFEDVAPVLLKAGFDSYSIYKKRKPVMVSL